MKADQVALVAEALTLIIRGWKMLAEAKMILATPAGQVKVLWPEPRPTPRMKAKAERATLTLRGGIRLATLAGRTLGKDSDPTA